MLDILRNQDAARQQQQQQLQQAQQQQQQQQQQHPFGLRQMNGAGAIPIQPGGNPRIQFANDVTRMRLQAALSRNNPNMQALQNMQPPANLGRQLELMGVVHQQNQHQPNSAANLAAMRQLQQQQQQEQQRLGGMANQMGQLPNQLSGGYFPSPNVQSAQEQAPPGTLGLMNQRAVMMQQQVGGPQPNGNVPPNANRPQMSQNQLRERAQLLTASIKELEKQSLMVQGSRAGRSDADYFSEIAKIQGEIANRKAVLLKIAQAMHSYGMGQTGTPGNV